MQVFVGVTWVPRRDDLDVTLEVLARLDRSKLFMQPSITNLRQICELNFLELSSRF